MAVPSTWGVRTFAAVCAVVGAGCMGTASYEALSMVETPGTPGLPEEPQIPAGPTCVAKPPPATPTRLLTRAEYDFTIRDLLMDGAKPARAFAAEPQVLGFENNADAHRVNAVLLSQYLEAAEALSIRARARGNEFYGCDPAAMGEGPCGEQFIVSFGRRAFRRTLTPDERSTLVSFFEATRTKQNFATAVEWSVQLVLQSPQFLYRIERGTSGASGDTTKLTGAEIASRLSYFLWSSMPDEPLLAAVERGELDTEAGIEAQARRMLADERAKDTVQSFFRQWLHLDGLEHMDKDASLGVQSTAGAAWRRSLELFVEDVAWTGEGTLDALLSSDQVYVDASLATLYGATPPAAGFEKRTLPDGKRKGLLTQPGLMAQLSGRVDSSPIRRGIFVREKLLCHQLAAPPADVPIKPPDPNPNATTRDRFFEHTNNAQCAGCHRLIDPVGFGFEHFDGAGRYRATENGLPVNAKGELFGTKDEGLLGPFEGVVELSDKLAKSPQVKGCVATQWFRFAMGRLEVPGDGCSLQQAQAAFEQSKGSFKELLVALTKTEAFRARRIEVGP